VGCTWRHNSHLGWGLIALTKELSLVFIKYSSNMANTQTHTQSLYTHSLSAKHARVFGKDREGVFPWNIAHATQMASKATGYKSGYHVFCSLIPNGAVAIQPTYIASSSSSFLISIIYLGCHHQGVPLIKCLSHKNIAFRLSFLVLIMKIIVIIITTTTIID